MICKCVCKPWLDLMTTPEFVKSHLSKSLPCVAVFLKAVNSKPYEIFESVDGLDLNCHWNRVFNFGLPFQQSLHSSVHGLLFLYDRDFKPIINLFLCNPIAREYISLPSPIHPSYDFLYCIRSYGFGVSKMSGQYKVVRISQDVMRLTPLRSKHNQFECHVYTVGSRSWRRITLGSLIEYKFNARGVFLNGNLHFLATKRFSSQSWIYCLDLETEAFSIFVPLPLNGYTCRQLFVLGEHLCVCDSSLVTGTFDYEINIWLMKEYGDEKSWTKEFISHKVDRRHQSSGYLCPIKVFKDGVILLMDGSGRKLLCYSNKTVTIREGYHCGFSHHFLDSATTIYTPSLLSLKTFEMENVCSF